jgi:hypothetical protein
LHLLALLVDEQFGVTDNVDEQDVADFEMKIRFTLSGHMDSVRRRISLDSLCAP